MPARQEPFGEGTAKALLDQLLLTECVDGDSPLGLPDANTRNMIHIEKGRARRGGAGSKLVIQCPAVHSGSRLGPGLTFDHQTGQTNSNGGNNSDEDIWRTRKFFREPGQR